jgi:UPF0755 protein
MVAKQRNRIVVISVFFFLIMQTLIFASIPKEANNGPRTVVFRSGTGLYDIAGLLEDDGIIYSSHLFVLLSLARGGKLIAGEYEFKDNMSTIGVIKKMRRGERNIYTLKIVEGYNLYNVADMVRNAKIMGKEEFMELTINRDFLKKVGVKADSLEGYLAPDTYYYSKEIDADKFIEKIVQRTLKLFEKEEAQSMLRASNMSVHEILTLASMIEKEAKMKDEKPLISAVFHNRLKKGMSLDCDPTVIYGTGAFSSPITKSDLTSYTPYNTYSFKGLPKGPICNPDKNSIQAALNPAPVDYLFFVSRNDGTHAFSADMTAHNRFVNLYQRGKNTKKQ